MKSMQPFWPTINALRRAKTFTVSGTFILAFAILFTLFTATTHAASRHPHVPRYAAIVVDAKTGRVLHAENADVLTYPASLTKMMTLYMTFQALDAGRLRLQQRLIVSHRATIQIPSKLGLRKEDTITVRDAMLGLITKSANDAAVVLAEALGGTEANFARLMTKKARALGMRHTTFYNASGVPHHRQRTTARDMALLSRAIWAHFPHYYNHFRTPVFHYRGQSHPNHNKLLGVVPGVDGIKTGFINASGFNLAASAKRNGRRLMVVVMGGRTRIARDQRVTQLINAYFAGSRTPSLLRAKPMLSQPITQPVSYKDESVDDTTPFHNAADNSRLPKRSLKPRYHLPTARPRVQQSRKPHQSWAIQVGAYPQAKSAHLATRRALQIVKLTAQRKVSVRPVRQKKRPLYQAQILGLTQREALHACRILGKKSLPCMAFSTQ